MRRQEETAKTKKVTDKKEGDDINWFGLKVGTGSAAFGGGAAGGVGKYLNSKRPLEGSGTTRGGGATEAKKRKIGFGEFEGW